VIVVPSLNTVRDFILGASRWRRGTVTRADQQYLVPGGKPLNVARFLGAMGVPCRLVVLADAALAAETARILPPRVSAELFVTAAPSRTDVAIVEDGGRITVLNGPPPPITADELDAALEAVRGALGERDLQHVLLIAGSQPLGAVDRLLEIAQRASARLLVDSSGADLLAALGGRPELVKVNVAELAEARGGDVERAWSDAPTLLPEAANVVVTRGRRGLRGWLGGAPVRVPAIRTRVVNPYGAGDAVTAALAASMLDGPPTVAALLDGAAWAAAVAAEFGLDLDPGKAATLRDGARAIEEGPQRG